MTYEQIFKRLPKALAAEAIRIKDEIRRVVQERFEIMQEAVKQEPAWIRSRIERYRQLGGPEKDLLQIVAQAYLRQAGFQSDQRTDLGQKKKT
jgi:hypothetical protein